MVRIMSRCKHTKHGANDYYDYNIDRYYKEREELFLEHVTKQALAYLDARGDKDITASGFSEEIEEFEFPDVSDWMSSEYSGAIGACVDQAYEEEKDRRMGL